MADLNFLNSSSPVQITGGDETLAADVFNSNGKNSLAVNVQNTINAVAQISGAGLLVSTSNTPLDLTTTFVSIVNKTGTGYIGGFKLIFSSDANVEVRLTVDSVISFTLGPDFLEDMSLGDTNFTGPNPWFGRDATGEFIFFPPYLIGYTTSLDLSVRKTTGSSRSLIRRYVVYS